MKWLAIRLGKESSDKSLPVPTDYRSRILHTNAQVSIQKGVLNILNVKDDYCFLWCILAHIHRADKHADELYNYRKYFNELDITGLNFPLKFTETLKFENIYPTISVNVLVYESKEVIIIIIIKYETDYSDAATTKCCRGTLQS